MTLRANKVLVFRLFRLKTHIKRTILDPYQVNCFANDLALYCNLRAPSSSSKGSLTLKESEREEVGVASRWIILFLKSSDCFRLILGKYSSKLRVQPKRENVKVMVFFFFAIFHCYCSNEFIISSSKSDDTFEFTFGQCEPVLFASNESDVEITCKWLLSN